MAVMMVASATAFAGDSDALKAIKKSKTYEDAESVLKSRLGELVNDQEKGKAYNYLVDFALKPYNAESKKVIENSANKQFGKAEVPVDNNIIVKYGLLAIEAAKECNKYDTKYLAKNKERLDVVFNDIIMLGITAAENSKDEECLQYLVPLFQYINDPLFEDVKSIKENPYLGAASYYSGRAAYFKKDYKKACDLLQVGVRDTAQQVRKLSFDLLLESMSSSRVTAEDSLKYQEEMKALYAKYPENDAVFAHYIDITFGAGDYDKSIEIANNHLAKYPNSVLPHIYIAYSFQQQKKYDDAISEWNLIPETQPNYAIFAYQRGVCKYFKANEIEDSKTDNSGRIAPEYEKIVKDLINQAMTDFEKAKELDPDHRLIDWRYLLKSVYTATGQKEKAEAIE